MSFFSDELDPVRQHIRAVVKYWWLIIVSVGLTLLDFVERILGTWWIISPTVWAVVAVGCVILAQYLAYRDLRKASDERVSEREFSLHLENEALRHGTAQLEKEIAHLVSERDSQITRVRDDSSQEINRLRAENAELKIRPYDDAQRQTVQSKLRTYSSTERDLLRFLMQRGETESSLIYKSSQDGQDFCSRALDRLGLDGMIHMREDMTQANVWRPRYYSVNPTLDSVLRDVLYPRQETEATSRFIV